MPRIGNAVVIGSLLAVAGNCSAADYGKLATLIFYVIAAIVIGWCGLTALIFHLLKGQTFWKRIGLSLLFLILPVLVLAVRISLEFIAEQVNF
jgi:hypothetical protein